MKKFLTLCTALLLFGSMTVKADTWTVAGSDATILGASWSPSTTANDMINVKSNEWYLLKANKSVSGTLEYKIVKNHEWGIEYPGSNASITLSGSSYDVLFKFVNDNNHSVSAAKVTSWTVAGTADVFGSGWNTEDTNNDMARSGNNWTLTKSHVLLAVGTTYQCKVAANHAWTYAFPGDNKEFSVAEDGYYDVTIDFNTTTLAVTVTTTFLEPAVPPTPTIALHSNISGSWVTSSDFDIAEGDATASLEMKNVSVGKYEFGININSSWTSNGAAFSRSKTANAITSGSGNCTFVADIAGDYTFTWTYETSTLSILYPDMTTAKIKFFAPRTENNPWDEVFAFVWNGDVIYSESWPGDEITETKSSGWYEYDVPVGASIIFSDNNTTNGVMKTADITNITADVCYVPTAINYSEDPKIVTVATDADCKVEYYIAGSKELLGGASDFAVFTALDENNQIKFENVPAGEYAFKINTGSSWVWALGGNQHLSDETGCGSIAKEVGTGDVGFAIDHTQDVTITYYPATQKICLGAETTKGNASVSVNDMSVYVGKTRSINATWTGNAEQIQYEILSGSEYINIADGKISGVAAGTATVRASVAETATYLGAYADFTVTVSALQTAKIKFFAPRTEDNPWAQVYAYAWIGDDPQSEPWPGDEITSTKNSGWYEYDVPVGANVLFTDYNTVKGIMKTTDIENVTVAKSYVSTSIYYPEDPTVDKIVTITEQNTVTYSIAGSKALIGGEAEADFDTNLPLDENNQIVFHDVEPGTYAFKINNNSWAWSIGGIDHMKEGECASIAQEVGVGDLGFKIDTKQDVTVTYYPETQEICLGAVTVKATTTVEGADMNIKAGESKKLAFSTNNTENPGVTYTILSGSEYIGMFQNVITGIKAGTTTVRVSLAETANYTAASDEFTITVSNPVAPAKAIEAIGGKFIINAKGDTAVFSRGNLKYNVGTQEWYCAEKQYDFVGENANLHFGDANYTGEYDLFGWSCTASNFGLMLSNHDEVYTGDFVDWGTKFSGEKTWSTLSSSQWQYMQAHQNWTMMALDPTPEVADNEDEIRGMAVFPYDWVTPAGFESLRMKFYDLDDEEKLADNTIALADWSTLEAAGAVFLPMAGARAGHWGNNWNGKAETTTTNPNPNGGHSYCFVDNEGWYGYYWLATTDSRSDHPYDAMYLICPSAYNTGKKDEHDEEIWAWSAPAVWSREKRRGNSVRLVNIVPRQYAVTYTAGEGEGAVPTDENKYLDGAEITLAAATGLSKEGYRFAGWKFKGTTYAAGASYTVNNVLANEQIVFEAQWEEDWQMVRENLSANAYYTMCLDKAVAEVRGGAIWRVLSKAANGVDVILEEVTGTLDAGRPYIFYATAANLEVIYTGDAVLAPLTEGNNGLIGSFTQQSIAQSPNNYIIYNNELYYVNSDNVYVGAYRAYLDMTGVPAYNSEPQQGAPRRRVMMSVHAPAVATGMEEVTGYGLPVTGKILIDGQIYILRGEKVYDMTGRLVK